MKAIKTIFIKLSQPVRPVTRYVLLAMGLAVLVWNVYRLLSSPPAERHYRYGNCGFAVLLLTAYQFRWPLIVAFMLRAVLWGVAIYLTFSRD